MNELEKYQFEVLERYVLEPDWLDQLIFKIQLILSRT